MGPFGRGGQGGHCFRRVPGRGESGFGCGLVVCWRELTSERRERAPQFAVALLVLECGVCGAPALVERSSSEGELFGWATGEVVEQLGFSGRVLIVAVHEHQ